ncbi:hypothetical protein R3P38DRAFT_3576308 [Favolaschia claudopus]|uniref:NAD(P)-binding protein n=1 Tax=Favolaschia claudopus TaxID=2862362 RepID=A0AAW0DMX9_9AGAR
MPCNKFLPDRDIADQSGKVIFVTGGNSGIGYETVKALLLKNAEVYLAARSKSKGMEAIQQLQTETGKRAEFIALDLADLRSVRKAAEEFLSREMKLDVLFNNGRVLSAVFMDAAKDGPARDALIKKVGSMMAPITYVHPDRTLYGASKTGNIFIANYYAKAHPGVLVSCSLHPGLIQTGLQRHSAFNRFFAAIAFSPPHVGAYTQLWAGMTATGEEINGKYFVPVGVERKLSGSASDKALEGEVIRYLKEAIKGF